MGRAAVLEELQVELDVLGQALLLGLLFQHLVAVLALGAGGDLDPAPDQVVALGHAVLVPHVVERALAGGVVGHEQEFVVIVLFDPVVAQPLGLGGQVALFGLVHRVAEVLLQALVQVGQLDHREGGLGHDDRQAEHGLDLVAVGVLDRLQGGLEQALLHGHHVPVGVDVAELQIEAGELGGVLVGVGLFGPEHRPHLKDALEAAGHGHLLVELGALGQVGVAVEVVHLEHFGAALAGGGDQLGGVDLDEVLVQQVLAHGVDQDGLGLEHQLVFVGAQVDPAVVDALVDAGALHRLLLFGGGDLLADDGQGTGDALDLDALGDHLDAAQLDVVVQAGLAHHRDDRVAGQLVDDGHKVGVVLFFNGDLQLAGDVLEHDKGHGLAAAQVFDKALHFYGLAGVAAHVGNIGSLHTKSSRPWRGAMGYVSFFNMS